MFYIAQENSSEKPLKPFFFYMGAVKYWSTQKNSLLAIDPDVKLRNLWQESRFDIHYDEIDLIYRPFF